MFVHYTRTLGHGLIYLLKAFQFSNGYMPWFGAGLWFAIWSLKRLFMLVSENDADQLENEILKSITDTVSRDSDTIKNHLTPASWVNIHEKIFLI